MCSQLALRLGCSFSGILTLCDKYWLFVNQFNGFSPRAHRIAWKLWMCNKQQLQLLCMNQSIPPPRLSGDMVVHSCEHSAATMNNRASARVFPLWMAAWKRTVKLQTHHNCVEQI